jgi:RHS repeat-associated protein
MKNFISIFSLITLLTVSVASQAEIVYIHNDALGSPIMETNELGSVISRNHYKPFGETIEPMKDGVGYTGHVNDTDLGLTYMQARYYDPVIGRFYSNDPIGYTAKNPVMSFNRYMYVNNNPYKYTDPDGEFFNLALGVIGATVGAISGGISSYVSSGGDWEATAQGAGVGALIGATAGFTGGASLVAAGKAADLSLKTASAGRALATMGKTSLKTGAVSATSNAAGQVIGNGGDLSKVSGTQVAVSGAAGLFPGLMGGVILEGTGTAGVASVAGIATATVVTDTINTVTQLIGSDIAKGLEKNNE